MASYGPKASADLGLPKGTPGALGRRVPSDAGMYATLRTWWHVLTDPLSDSLTVLKAPRLQPKTQLSSAHYSRMSLTRTSSCHSPSLPGPPVCCISFFLPPSPNHSSTHRTPRLPRVSTTQDSSRLNQKIFHLPDGSAQRARDEAMCTAMVAELSERGKLIPTVGNPNQWADRTKSRIEFGYDTYTEVEW